MEEPLKFSRFCFRCGTPSEEWPKPERAKKSPYCTPECRRLAVNEKRDIRASKYCRLCGHKKGKKAVKAGRDIIAGK